MKKIPEDIADVFSIPSCYDYLDLSLDGVFNSAPLYFRLTKLGHLFMHPNTGTFESWIVMKIFNSTIPSILGLEEEQDAAIVHWESL